MFETTLEKDDTMSRVSVRKISYLVIKRIFDILISIIGLILLIPIALIIKVAYMCTGDFTSIFFVQERIGKNGKLFKFFKFRSMVPNADEILFKSKINPLKKGCELNKKDFDNIIKYTREILDEAIKKGGTTIKSYESSRGVHGKFQNNLLVHNHENDECKVCKSTILKIKVNGRGTYYCPKCQR